jgi:PAS domain S-box-containing protein
VIVDTTANSGFQFLFYDNPQPMWIYDEQTLNILEVNPAAVTLYGYSREEWLQKKQTDLHPKEETGVVEVIPNNVSANSLLYTDVQHLTKGGAVLYVKVCTYATHYNGTAARLMQVSPDECKAMADGLADTRKRLNRVLNKTTVGYCQVNCSWEIADWNPAMQELIEYRYEDVIHKNFWQVLPELAHTDFYISCLKARNEQTTVDFIEYFWPLQKWFSVLVYPAEGGLVLQLKDITNKKLFENALIDKLEQLKQVSFFNSHFIRKPVASLIGLTQLVQDNLVDVTHFKEIAGYISESSRELDDMLKRMNKMLNADKNNYLQRTLNGFHFSKLLKETISNYALLHPEYDFNLHTTGEFAYYGNERAIQAAINALLDNAINLSGTHRVIDVKSGMKDGHLIVSVQNDGAGLSAHQLLEYFEAYNRNKITPAISSGLAKMFAIVKKHHGNFWVESVPGAGSEFFLSFPLSNIASYKLNEGSLFSVYQAPEVLMEYNPQLQCLVANWMGFHDAGSVKAWAIDVLNEVKKQKPRMLLIDNSDLLGIWEGAVRWVNFEWTPKVREAGVSHMAIVYSACTFSRLSADHIKLHKRTDVVIQHFSTKNEALTWLQEQQQGTRHN